MKILFVQPTADKKGHYGKYTLNLCQNLARLGNEVVLFTNKVEPSKFIKEPPMFRIVEYKEGSFSFGRFDAARKTRPWLYLWGYLRNSFVIFKAALDFAKKEKFDVVQVTDVEFGILALLLALKGRGVPPIVLLIHAPNFSFSKYPGNAVFRLYKVLQRELLRTRLGREINAIVSLGEYHKSELQKQFRLAPAFLVDAIHDGAEPPPIFLETTEARKKLGMDYDGAIFMLFGMLRKDKGIEYLFEAASLIKSENFKLLVAGSPFDYGKEEIADMIKNFGIEDKVVLSLDYIPDEEVSFYFFAADCVVFPYRKIYTGGTGPLLKEAAMHKKPVIASEVSEMGYLVKNREMGFVVEPEKPELLAEKMKEFLRLPEERRKNMGENGFRTANTWQKMAPQYLNLYEKIIIPAKN